MGALMGWSCILLRSQVLSPRYWFPFLLKSALSRFKPGTTLNTNQMLVGVRFRGIHKPLFQRCPTLITVHGSHHWSVRRSPRSARKTPGEDCLTRGFQFSGPHFFCTKRLLVLRALHGWRRALSRPALG